MATYTEGDFFGEAALIYDNPTIPVTIRCEQEGLRALLIRKEKFQALMDEHPMVTHRILWNLFTELTVSQRDLIIRLTDSIRHQRKS